MRRSMRTCSCVSKSDKQFEKKIYGDYKLPGLFMMHREATDDLILSFIPGFVNERTAAEKKLTLGVR